MLALAESVLMLLMLSFFIRTCKLLASKCKPNGPSHHICLLSCFRTLVLMSLHLLITTELDDDASKLTKVPAKPTKLAMAAISTWRNMMSSVTNLNSPVDEDVDWLNSLLGSCLTWNSNTSTTHPFPDLQSMVLLALVDGDNNMFSCRILKKILFTIRLVLKLQEEAITNGSPFKLSRLDALLNYQSRKKSKLPVLTSIPVTIDLLKNKSVLAYVNMPSDHLKLLATNPVKAKSMFAMPDHMPDQFVCLQQGKKWRTHKNFQQPMFTHNKIDFWSGMLLSLPVALPMPVSFYNVLLPENNHFVHIETKRTSMRVKKLLQVDASPIDIDFCFSVSPRKIDPVLPVHWSLLLVPHFLKRHIPQDLDNLNNKNHFYKVRIAMITLFTNDMLGSWSKQYNPYKSWSMKCAALSFEEKSLIENIYFLSAILKKDGASGMSLLPVFVKDLKMLEAGLVMFSAEDNEHVLVVGPLLWIEADTPCHSELCGLRASTCLTAEKLKDEIHYTGSHASRTKERYQIATSTPDRSSTILDAPLTGKNFKASELSFQYMAMNVLLDLDSFDPSTNTPVEILHNILLGVAKYLVTDLVKVVLKGHPGLLNKLIDSLNEYEKSQGLSRKFTRLLRHCGSFLGRDFKILVQILPIVLATEFVNDNDLSLITPCFVHLGRLCSLVFVRAVNLIQKLYFYDKNCGIEGHKPYTSKPKVQLLTHLPDDLQRFGTALHYETEKGEQFNKHIREHLMHTNRLNTSRDVCLKFAKQAVMRHVIDGGSWMNKDGQREHYGGDTAVFLHENVDKNFQDILFGRLRDFANNNDIDNIADLPPRNNTFGVFVLNESRDQPVHYIIGKVSSLRVEHYRVESSAHGQENNFLLA
ncbi:hypothetical protein PHYBLDRAFT_72696 [Phycomyces blakesleeanus NRRL 1555(-)]|uniref:PI-PLC Y-box domain-containing protein n=1 Tax=Phycomyces blakesleeanus (strain ATCC 8743b / DSM 1359 / FGSC 10004 / NBRC 33097 / NRRL 1555) TaxID=763407 RepID=A0A162TXM4_PHYB8|nr:hypothetical protein PHYBLDRAFT_72696 [Phycomyces blakesleeanus NRRL 1555(-)]OAD71822.1 hypothetical protein PHYBLDRAFT_72696 [Phycomyces blakesleeanus NRRL 1555(-)]|eukprot:XP_018289862.1 hypothetical protein PHYBLDRAFT_72696 [Phycomyces blakesleeanus NRRL 1555(-)]